jgi:hypothetical protein
MIEKTKYLLVVISLVSFTFSKDKVQYKAETDIGFNTSFGETAYQVKTTRPSLFIKDVQELARRCDGLLSEDYRIVKQLADDSVQRGGIQYITRHKVQEPGYESKVSLEKKIAAEGEPLLPANDPGLFSKHLADYDSELRRPDGRVDIDAMVARLKELGVTTYYWLIWHAPTDWEDLKLFLPKAAEAGINVWVYLVPPSESPPRYSTRYSEPFRLDYQRWAEEIAKLSLQNVNLTAWVIDDFYANRTFFTPDYLREMQARAKRINPRLAFLPLMYFNEISPKFTEDYRQVIDGVVVAYLQDRNEIERTWAILNDATIAPPSELGYPYNTPSKAGDFVMVSQTAKVLTADRYVIAFRERDDFTGPTSGYHFKQLLVDGMIVWDQDVAGGSPAWNKITVDVTDQVRGKTSVTVAFRLLDRKGVSNFGVRWRLSELRAEGLQLAADITEPAKWQVDRQGAFETGFGKAPKVGRGRFHIPFVSMTAANQSEFHQRHGDPATPERVAEYLRMSLQAWQDGKCDGVVTYCLDIRPQSQTFPLIRDLFQQYGRR